MIPISGRTASRALLLAALVLAAAGCGLSEEVDRELDPGRTAASEKPSPAVTYAPRGPEAGDASVATPTPSDAGPTGGTSTACPSSGVRMLPGPVEAAMGLRAMSVTLTNCGGKPYVVDGYPWIQVLDEDGEPYDGVRVLQGPQEITTGVPDFGAHPVTLEPGRSARTSLVWRNTVTEVDVPAVNAPNLRIAPLDGRPAEVLAPEGGLDLGNTGRLGTTAWAEVADGS